MLTLMVRQSLKNGSVKTWKLKSTQSKYTFGSSRLADMISISADSKGIQGMFEFRNNKWYYEAMQGAINSYNYTREKDDDYEIWTEIIYPKLEM